MSDNIFAPSNLPEIRGFLIEYLNDDATPCILPHETRRGKGSSCTLFIPPHALVYMCLSRHFPFSGRFDHGISDASFSFTESKLYSSEYGASTIAKKERVRYMLQFSLDPTLGRLGG